MMTTVPGVTSWSPSLASRSQRPSALDRHRVGSQPRSTKLAEPSATDLGGMWATWAYDDPSSAGGTPLRRRAWRFPTVSRYPMTRPYWHGGRRSMWWSADGGMPLICGEIPESAPGDPRGSVARPPVPRAPVSGRRGDPGDAGARDMRALATYAPQVGLRRWVAVAFGVVAVGLVGWGLLAPTSHPWRGRKPANPAAGTGQGRVMCGSYLLPRQLDSNNEDAVVDHSIGCEGPRERHLTIWVGAGLAVGLLGGVALRHGPAHRKPIFGAPMVNGT